MASVPVAKPAKQTPPPVKAPSTSAPDAAPAAAPTGAERPGVLAGKPPIVIGAVAVVALIVVIGIVAALAAGSRNHTAAAPPPTSAPGSSVVATSTGNAAPIPAGAGGGATATPVTAATAMPGMAASPTAMAGMGASTTPVTGPAPAPNLRATPTPAPTLVIPAEGNTTPAPGKLAYTNFRGPDKYGDLDIMIQDVPGSAPRQYLQYGSDPSFSPDATRILYYSWTEMGFYSMDLNGKNQKMVSQERDDAHPAWSPDGKSIAFENGGDIWVMNADGSNRTKVIEGAEMPAWSPDSKQLVYKGCVPPRCGLVIAGADGKNAHLLTSEPTDEAPSWQPGGDLIAFTSHRSGNMEVWVVWKDGSAVRQLTTSSTTGAMGAMGAMSGAPSWSPDGRTIYFRSDRDGNWGVYSMSRDGSGQAKVATANATEEWWKERISVSK